MFSSRTCPHSDPYSRTWPTDGMFLPLVKSIRFPTKHTRSARTLMREKNSLTQSPPLLAFYKLFSSREGHSARKPLSLSTRALFFFDSPRRRGGFIATKNARRHKKESDGKFSPVGCVKVLRRRTALLHAKQIGASAAYLDTPYYVIKYVAIRVICGSIFWLRS
jgi:hypothetical protein